jgi:hypothetical protein
VVVLAGWAAAWLCPLAVVVAVMGLGRDRSRLWRDRSVLIRRTTAGGLSIDGRV